MRSIVSAILLAIACGLISSIPLASASGAREASAEQQLGSQAADDWELLQIIKDDMARAGSGRFGVAVKHLPTGRTVYWNAERSYRSASIYKLYVMYEAFRQQRAGVISFDGRMVITAAIANVNGGYSPVPIGSSITIRRAVELMITVSDNASAVALRQRLGVGSINTSIRQRLGLTDTSIAYDSRTSPRDLTRFFDGLARLSYLDPDASKEMTRLLLAQRHNDRIPQNLPKWVWVAHKTGELDGVRNDAGIVYTPAGPVIIAIVDDGAWNIGAIYQAEARLAADVYKYASAGKFGSPTNPPFLYDPELEARLKPVLAAAGGRSIDVQHLDTGQGTLVQSRTAWPLDSAFDPDGLADPRAVKARRAEPRAACGGEAECVAVLSDAVGGDEFERRVKKGDLNEGAALLSALTRAQKAGSIVAKLPAEDVVAYLDSRQGGTVREVAVIRAGSGRYVVTSSAPASAVGQLQNVGTAIHSYLASCVWGYRANPQACASN